VLIVGVPEKKALPCRICVRQKWLLMRRAYKINQEDIGDFFFVIAPLSFFLPLRLFNLVLVGFMIVSLLSLKDRLGVLSWKGVCLLSLPFFIFLYGVFLDIFHAEIKRGFHELESFLPLLFFPLILSFTGVTGKRVRLSKVSFFYGSIVAALVILIIAFWKNATDHERVVHNWNYIETMRFYENNPIGLLNWGFFIYNELSFAINFHPIYLATYFIIAIIFGLSLVKEVTSLRQKVIVSAGVGLLGFEIFLLSGRMPIIVLGLIIFAYAFNLIRLQRNASRRVVMGVVFVVLLMIPLLMPATLYRLRAAYEALTGPYDQQDIQTTSLHRLTIWKQSADLFLEKPLFGYGLFGGEQAIDSKVAPEQRPRYNTHNQYLMIMLTAGIVGLLLIVYYYSALFLKAFRQAHYIYILFLFVILLVLLTENFISRHKGVILYAYFNTLLFFSLPGNDKKI
jgi:O-antigen ligase